MRLWNSSLTRWLINNDIGNSGSKLCTNPRVPPSLSQPCPGKLNINYVWRNICHKCRKDLTIHVCISNSLKANSDEEDDFIVDDVCCTDGQTQEAASPQLWLDKRDHPGIRGFRSWGTTCQVRGTLAWRSFYRESPIKCPFFVFLFCNLIRYISVERNHEMG